MYTSGDFKLREIKKRNKIINNKRKIREKKVFNNKSGKSERPELKVYIKYKKNSEIIN